MVGDLHTRERLSSPDLLLRSYTPLIIPIQQMLEYDNVNRLSDAKVR